MRYVVASNLLLSRLQNIERVILPKNNIEILSCFLFDIKGTQMGVTASDQETILHTNVELSEAAGDCKFALDAKQLMNVLKEIPDQPLTLDVDSGKLQIGLLYQNGHFTLQGQAGDEYPELWKVDGEDNAIELPSVALSKGLQTALTATAADESRRVMNGIYMDITPDDLSVVASDGHKLVCYRVECDTHGLTTHYTLPQKPASILKAIIEKEENNITIHAYSSGNAMVTTENYSLSCRLIEEKYPNYKSVIPKQNENIATIDRASLQSAIRRVLVVADKTTALIKLKFDQNLVTLTSENINYALSAEEKLVCSYEGMAFKIGFKGTDLLDLINNLTSKEVVLKLADASRAGLILPSEQDEKTDLLMLLMPLLIND